MEGTILTGGSGTRLYPLACAISKQLMPVYYVCLGIPDVFVQDNHPRSGRAVLRGLDYLLDQPTR